MHLSYILRRLFLLIPVLLISAALARAEDQRATPLELPVLHDLDELVAIDKGATARLHIEQNLQRGTLSAPAAALLQARVHTLLGDLDKFSSALLSIASDYPFLEDAVLQMLLELYIEEEETSGALAIFNRFAGSGNVNTTQAKTLLEIADQFRQKEEWKQAEALYLRVLRTERRSPTADRSRLGLADTRFAIGSTERALKNLRYLQEHFRDPAFFEQARLREIDHHAKAGNLRPPFSESTFRTLADRLIDRAAYQTAQSLINEWQSRYPDSESRDRMDYLRLLILRHQRKDSEALVASTAFLKVWPDSTLKPQVHFQQLVLMQRLGKTEQLRSKALAYWKGDFGGSAGQRRSAAMLLAAYLVSAGHDTEGLALYRTIYRSGVPRSLQNDILWRVGVGALRDGQNERAEANLRVLLRRRPGGLVKRSARYWLAEAELRLGERQTAVDVLTELISEKPYDYYGFLARARLVDLEDEEVQEWLNQWARGTKESSKPFPELTLSSRVRSSPEFLAIQALAQAGLNDYIAGQAVALQRRYRGNREVAYFTARALARAGDYSASSRLAEQYFKPWISVRSVEVPQALLELIYPRPFYDKIRVEARGFNLDPDFMASIMRQESRFDPGATSWVGARGLFQFMDYTAAQLAPHIGMPAPEPDQLYQPDVNIRLAAYYQSKLLRHFNKRIAPVVASYNAGEARVSAWWQAARADKLPEDLFIDTIPYRETRRFTRAVLTNYFQYMRIYSD